MNTVNNRRRKESRRRMEEAFMNLIQTTSIERISVTEICRIAGVNRTTFYSNYDDIYALAESIQQQLHNDVISLYENEIQSTLHTHDFTKLLYHIYSHQLEYHTFFRLNPGNKIRFVMYDPSDAAEYVDTKYIDYHIAFFANGFNAIIRMWLENGCCESPDEIRSILETEYYRKPVAR